MPKSIKEFPVSLLEQRKTKTGYLSISNAVLTASDLVQFEKRIGGLDRAASVLNELIDEIAPLDFNTDLLRHSPVSVLQRLGYLLEFVCSRKDLPDALFQKMKIEKLRSFRIPLKINTLTKGFSAKNRWNVIANIPIEAEP